MATLQEISQSRRKCGPALTFVTNLEKLDLKSAPMASVTQAHRGDVSALVDTGASVSVVHRNVLYDMDFIRSVGSGLEIVASDVPGRI